MTLTLLNIYLYSILLYLYYTYVSTMCIYCDYCVYHYKSTELISLYTLLLLLLYHQNSFQCCIICKNLCQTFSILFINGHTQFLAIICTSLQHTNSFWQSVKHSYRSPSKAIVLQGAQSTSTRMTYNAGSSPRPEKEQVIGSEKFRTNPSTIFHT